LENCFGKERIKEKEKGIEEKAYLVAFRPRPSLLAPCGPVLSPTPLAFFSTAAQQTAAQARQARARPLSPTPFLSLAAGPPSSLPLTCGTRQAAPPSSSLRVPEGDFLPPTDSILKSAG